MTRAAAVILGVALVLVVAGRSHASVDARTERAPAASAKDLHRSAGCRVPNQIAPGTSQHTIRSGGRDRVYELDVPPGYDGTVPYGLVLGLHALTVDFRFVPAMTGFAQGSRWRFIGVSPSGVRSGATPYWDAAPTVDNYDVRFISDLLESLEKTLCIDTRHVYSTGMSNGAQMSSLLACRLPGRIDAIAPVSGEEFLEPCNGRPVPIMAFHGTADPILPYSGGGLNATKIAEIYHYQGSLPPGLPQPLGIDASMSLWARHNKCDARPHDRRVAPHVVQRTWSGCAAATVLYVIEGGGHAWPGQPVPAFENMLGPGTTEIDATDLMLHFFFGRHP